MAENDLRYPIGKFDGGREVTAETRAEFIQTIADLPRNLAESVADLNDGQLDTPYRPDGWTVRQTIHHVADSHINAYTRFKFALTEEMPPVRGYLEARWAELPDSKLPVEISLRILDGLHTRWANLLNRMTDEDFERKLLHSESGEWTLAKMLGLYSWHSRHHTAHITKLRERNDW